MNECGMSAECGAVECDKVECQVDTLLLALGAHLASPPPPNHPYPLLYSTLATRIVDIIIRTHRQTCTHLLTHTLACTHLHTHHTHLSHTHIHTPFTHMTCKQIALHFFALLHRFMTPHSPLYFALALPPPFSSHFSYVAHFFISCYILIRLLCGRGERGWWV